MTDKTRRMTIDELIRETKPDWESVAYQEERTSTRPFSGVPVVRMGTGISMADQAEMQVGGRAESLYPTKTIDDTPKHAASGLPGQDD